MTGTKDIDLLAHKAALDLEHNAAYRSIQAYFQKEYDKLKEQLVDAAPNNFLVLQGQARTYRHILGLKNRAQATKERRTQATA